jgi:hypothetical protein
MDGSKRRISGRALARRKPKVSPSQRNTLENLALELQDVVACTLRGFGVSAADQERRSKRPRRHTLDTPVSHVVLRRYTQLGDLIASWYGDTQYLDQEGKPRVLPIEGSGTTFESLVRKFIPGMATREAVAFACRVAEIGTLPDGKVALFGTALVRTSADAEAALAQCIFQFASLARTSLDNFQFNSGKSAGVRMERLIRRFIPMEEFERFQTQIRPQIHDLCEKVDGMLQPLEVRASRSRKHKAGVGMGIYLYADGGSAKARRAVNRRAADL